MHAYGYHVPDLDSPDQPYCVRGVVSLSGEGRWRR